LGWQATPLAFSWTWALITYIVEGVANMEPRWSTHHSVLLLAPLLFRETTRRPIGSCNASGNALGNAFRVIIACKHVHRTATKRPQLPSIFCMRSNCCWSVRALECFAMPAAACHCCSLVVLRASLPSPMTPRNRLGPKAVPARRWKGTKHSERPRFVNFEARFAPPMEQVNNCATTYKPTRE